jgi:DNA-binding Lrp family transcriptional regulator
MRTFTELEQKILNRIQNDIKITPDPLKDLADEMNIDEDKFFTAVRRLKDEKIIRDISGIFNADRLGYKSSLIAFEIPHAGLEHASEIINKNPGVSHNYLREHKYNIWFTLAVDSGRTLENESRKLAEECGAADILILKTERLLKIGLRLNIGNDEDEGFDINAPATSLEKKAAGKEINENEKKVICILQTDLPLVDRPYKSLIEKNNVDIDETEIIQTGGALKKTGIMRRYSAVLKHQNAGYSSNAMTAWKTDDINFNDSIIQSFSSVPNISHLYIRTVHPGKWEHPLFAMIHAKNDNGLNRIIKNLEIKTGIKDYLVLKTLKEFKKKRIKYFQD